MVKSLDLLWFIVYVWVNVVDVSDDVLLSNFMMMIVYVLMFILLFVEVVGVVWWVIDIVLVYVKICE